MKAELTQELKERFFSLYWGLLVMTYDSDEGNIYFPAFPDGAKSTSMYLLLRPLSDLTDEEAGVIMDGRTAQEAIQYYSSVERFQKNLEPWQYDYLRSIGIALPFMGHSVQELCDAGWVKLIS